MRAVASGFSPSTCGFKPERNKSLSFRKFPCVMVEKAMCKHHDNGRKKLLVHKFTTALEADAVLETASAAAALTESTLDLSEASASEKSFQRATIWMRQQEILED
jgi:hypothetical protein